MWLVREKEREEDIRKQNEAEGILPYEEQETKPEKQWKIWLRNTWTYLSYSQIFRAFIILIAVAIVIPIFIILFLDTTNAGFDETHSCSMKVGYEITCGAQNTTFEKCAELKCCFNETDGSCFHKVRSYYQYAQKEDDSDSNLFYPVEKLTPFGVENIPVYLNIKKESSYKLSIILSTSQDDVKTDNITFDNEEYETKVFTNYMAVEVNRTNSTKRLLSTTRGATIISNRYWEWTVDLFAEHLFGMDFLHIHDNQTCTKVIYKNSIDHSSVARFISYSSDKFHGLEVDHSGPLEVTVTPAKLLVLRLFSGSKLTLKLTTGPTPVDVLRQFRDNEMWTPIPQWLLGVHVCRDGNISDVDEILSEVKNMPKSFPYDSDCIHENLFSLSKNKGIAEVEDAVKEVKLTKKFLMSLSPQVLVDDTYGSNYKIAEQLNILYTKDGKILKGKYLNETVAYPDYNATKAQQWFKDFYDTELVFLNPDGLILRNSWPVNDGYELKTIDTSKFQHMPQEVERALSSTLPWDSVSSSSVQHIDAHNSYGLKYADVVASHTKSPFILSTAFTHGSHYPAHIQNINVSWVNFKDMLRKTLSHSLFGGPLFSVPVCGDTEKFSKEINQAVCLRWYLTAATMPLFRISSDMPRRFPSEYDDVGYVKNIMLNAIKTRYSLLPYYYTILSENLPMVRPMFFNFPENNETFSLDEQYMIGEALLIAQPSLYPTPNINIYLPKISGGWYDFWGGGKYHQIGWFTIPIVESDLSAFIAAGKIVPIHDETGNSVEETLEKPLKLVIALHCKENDGTSCSAAGTMYTKNSITVEFIADKNSLVVMHAEACSTGKTPDFTMSNLKIYDEDVKYYEVPTGKFELCVKQNVHVKLDYSQLTPM